MTFLTTVFWGTLVLFGYIGLVLLIARFCGLNTRYEHDHEEDR